MALFFLHTNFQHVVHFVVIHVNWVKFFIKWIVSGVFYFLFFVLFNGDVVGGSGFLAPITIVFLGSAGELFLIGEWYRSIKLLQK